MKKIFTALLLIALSVVFFSTTTTASEKGSRTNPFSAYEPTTFTFQNYDFDTPKLITLQLESLTSGKSVNDIIMKENMFNDKPTSQQQWMLMKFKVSHISNPNDEALELSDVIQYYSDDFYFDSNFKSIPFISSATFGDIYEQYDLMDQSIYPGSSTSAYTAQLFNKSTPYPYFRILRSNGQYYWFSTNPSYKPRNTIDISKAGISTKVTSTYTYTSKALKPKITVYDKQKKVLRNNIDYTISYSNNIKAGYGKYTVTGKGNYYGSKNYSFKINPKKITDKSITTKVSSTNTTYTGKALKPKITVYDKQIKTLKNNTDYTITYSNNKKVGYGKYTVKGKGNYSGSKNYSFKIKPKKVTVKSIKNSKAKQVDVKWNKVTGAKYYKVFYKTGSKTKSLTVKGTSASIKKLSKNKKYSFYVTAYYDSKVYSSKSSTKNLTIKK